jgi:hypothetical protein
MVELPTWAPPLAVGVENGVEVEFVCVDQVRARWPWLINAAGLLRSWSWEHRPGGQLLQPVTAAELARALGRPYTEDGRPALTKQGKKIYRWSDVVRAESVPRLNPAGAPRMEAP